MQLGVCGEGNTTKESQWNYLCSKGLSRVQEYKSLAINYLCSKGLSRVQVIVIHTGVVPFKKICDHFQSMEETKHMEIELLLQFMIHMEVCREITDPNMLELLAINYPDYKKIAISCSLV